MRIMTMSRRRLTAVALAAVAACSLSGWLLIDRFSTARAAPPSEAYAELKQPATDADALRETAVPIARLASDQPEVDPSGARRLTSSEGDVVALVPRRDGRLCMHIVRSDGSAGGSCPDAETAAKQGIVAGAPGTQIGVVPDAVSQVTFRLTDGSTTNTTVRSNVYRAPAKAVSAQFTVDGGTQTVALLPEDTFEKAFKGNVAVP